MLNKKIDKIIENKNATLNDLKEILTTYNNGILDNNKIDIDLTKIDKIKSIININYENEFINTYVTNAKKDKKQAINSLLTNFNFKQITTKINDNNTIDIVELDSKNNDIVKLFDFAKLEKAYQIANSNEKDKNGHTIPNKSVTIFSALRIYGLLQIFSNNLIMDNFDKKDLEYYGISLENITVKDEKIFDENDQKAFIPNDKKQFSNNQIEKQLNIIVKLMGFDNVKLLNRDVKVLRLVVQKIKQNNQTAKHNIKQIDILKFANHIFSRIIEYTNK